MASVSISPSDSVLDPPTRTIELGLDLAVGSDDDHAAAENIDVTARFGAGKCSTFVEGIRSLVSGYQEVTQMRKREAIADRDLNRSEKQPDVQGRSVSPLSPRSGLHWRAHVVDLVRAELLPPPRLQRRGCTTTASSATVFPKAV